MDELTQLLADLEVNDAADFGAMRGFLDNHDIPADRHLNLMKRLLKKMQAKKCCNCHMVYDARPELIRHLRKRKHLYGQDRYAKEKREMIQRIGFDRAGIAEDQITVASNEPLTDVERAAFARIWTLDDLTAGERASYENLLFIGFCLIHIGGAQN
jgi:hypothetical protein